MLFLGAVLWWMAAMLSFAIFTVTQRPDYLEASATFLVAALLTVIFDELRAIRDRLK